MLAVRLSSLGQCEEAEAAISKGASINPALLDLERAMMHAAHGSTDQARAEIVRLEA